MNFKDLKKICDKHGVAAVASRLGLRDTFRVKTWLMRKTIPKIFIDLLDIKLKDLKDE
jgi:hypothetical protein